MSLYYFFLSYGIKILFLALYKKKLHTLKFACLNIDEHMFNNVGINFAAYLEYFL